MNMLLVAAGKKKEYYQEIAVTREPGSECTDGNHNKHLQNREQQHLLIMRRVTYVRIQGSVIML